MLEVDRQAARINMLEETVRRKQYELDQVRDRLERREKDIETLKAEIMKLHAELIKNNCANCVLRKHLESEVKE